MTPSQIQDLAAIRAELGLARALVHRGDVQHARSVPAFPSLHVVAPSAQEFTERQTSQHQNAEVFPEAVNMVAVAMQAPSPGQLGLLSPTQGHFQEASCDDWEQTDPTSSTLLRDDSRQRIQVQNFPRELLNFDEMPTPTHRRSTAQRSPALRPVAAKDITMARARALTQMTLEELMPEQQHSESSCVGRLRQQCQAARSRIQANLSSVGKAVDGIRSLESSAAEAEDAIHRLRHMRNVRAVDLAVCQRRLEILAGEDFVSCRRIQGGDLGKHRQDLLESLEVEQQILLQSKAEISALETEVGVILEGLADTRMELSRQAFERRSAMRAEHATLVQAARPLSPGPSIGTAVRPGSAPRQRTAEDDGWGFFQQRLHSLRAEVSQLCERCSVVIQWTDCEHSKASLAARDQLTRCVAEEQELRRKIEAQLKEVDFAISAAEWTFSRASRKANAPNHGKNVKAEKASVFLHELKSTKRHLQGLLRRSLQDAQLVEACRKVSPATCGHGASNIINSKSGQKKRPTSASGARQMMGKAPTARTGVSSLKRSSSHSSAVNELQSLRAEEAKLRSNLQVCKDSVDRCTVWAAVLSELEGRVKEALAAM